MAKPVDVMEAVTSEVQTDVEEEMGDVHDGVGDELDASDFEFPEINEPELESQEERERFYQEVWGPLCCIDGPNFFFHSVSKGSGS